MVGKFKLDSQDPRDSLFLLDTCAAFCGLRTYGSRNSWVLNLIQKSSFVTFVLFSIYVILIHAYFSFTNGFLAVNLAKIAVSVMSTKLLLDAHFHGHEFDQLLETLLLQLGPRCAPQIRRAQVVPLVAICFIFASAEIGLFGTFIFKPQGLRQLEMLLHGSSNVQGNPVLIMLSSIGFESHFMIAVISYFYYILLQTLLELFAQKCHREFPLMVRMANVTAICKYCQFFNEVRLVSNELMGFIPFHSFALKWMSFIFGVTSTITNTEKLTSCLVLFILATLILVNSSLLFKTVFIVSRADSYMKKARRSVGGLLMASGQIGPQNQLSQWTVYTIQDPLVPAMVWHFFKIHPSLILISFNTMITFSVMALTTASAFIKS